MSALDVAIVAIGAVGLVSTVATMTLTVMLLRKRGVRSAGASSRVSGIRVIFEDGHTRTVPPTAATVKVLKQAIQAESAVSEHPSRAAHSTTRG